MKCPGFEKKKKKKIYGARDRGGNVSYVYGRAAAAVSDDDEDDEEGGDISWM